MMSLIFLVLVMNFKVTHISTGLAYKPHLLAWAGCHRTVGVAASAWDTSLLRADTGEQEAINVNY